MNKTGIEYLDYTLNPIAMLCEPVSAGCQNCWHRTRAAMLAKNPSIPKEHQAAYAGRTGPTLIKSRLDQLQKRKKPATIGVQFMGDLWHKNIDWPMIDQVFEACHKADWHTYVFLTKRIEAAWYYFDSPIYNKQNLPRRMFLTDNIYFGASVENQEMADKRVKILLQIPAAVRFVSVEPMLEEINLSLNWRCSCGSTVRIDHPSHHHKGCAKCDLGVDLPRLDWVIAGPETGPGARECKPEWIADLYEQCKAAGVPFFDKRENFIVREFPNAI